jgi:hypothetical protein
MAHFGLRRLEPRPIEAKGIERDRVEEELPEAI